MFRGMIDEIKSAASEVAARIATRAAIGVVFMVAIGFAVAAITLQLVERFGGITASYIIAAVFALLGLLGVVVARVHDSKVEERKVEEEKQAEAEPSLSKATSEAAMHLPLALIGSVLTSTSGFISPLTVLRFAARNAALLVFGGILTLILWPQNKVDVAPPLVDPAE